MIQSILEDGGSKVAIAFAPSAVNQIFPPTDAKDPDSLQVIARAPVGPDPHEVIASADGKTAYVSIYGGGRYHALSVIDLVAQKALPDIDTGALPPCESGNLAKSIFIRNFV
jgi:DNA-binding beta-propeller fold protein YncE